jgi:hypothetical protein
MLGIGCYYIKVQLLKQASYPGDQFRVFHTFARRASVLIESKSFVASLSTCLWKVNDRATCATNSNHWARTCNHWQCLPLVHLSSPFSLAQHICPFGQPGHFAPPLGRGFFTSKQYLTPEVTVRTSPDDDDPETLTSDANVAAAKLATCLTVWATLDWTLIDTNSSTCGRGQRSNEALKVTRFQPLTQVPSLLLASQW